jgi:hypothetical protein
MFEIWVFLIAVFLRVQISVVMQCLWVKPFKIKVVCSFEKSKNTNPADSVTSQNTWILKKNVVELEKYLGERADV